MYDLARLCSDFILRIRFILSSVCFGHRVRAVVLLCGAVIGSVPVRAGIVARWRFEPATEVQPTAPEPRGASGSGREWLVLARGAGLGPGKFGQALWPAGSDGTRAGRISPLPRRVAADAGRLDGVTNPMDSRLNLGAHDWSIECWLRLEAGATDEGVIYEIGSGPPGANELVTRFSVWPRENAFVLTGIGPVGPGEAESVGRRIEFSDPAGPPDGVARLEHVTLAPAGTVLPREQWMHVALGHDAAAGLLRLFLGGRLVATAPARLTALPRGPAAYVALGCDGRRGRVLPGAMDELRVSDYAGPARDFDPDSTPAPLENP
jgi:hypothetical protein